MMGGSVVSKNIIEKKGVLKWCVKEKPVNDLDNGWRFFSNIDTDEYLSDSSNMCVYNYDTIVEIEPAIISIYNLPIGTDLTLMRENDEMYFIDNKTGNKMEF